MFSAAALKALLEALTAEGCVVVTTSNRHPADLPRHGLHEAMFGHFLNTYVGAGGPGWGFKSTHKPPSWWLGFGAGFMLYNNS